RRRHTRFSRDWSSDVCSSDLMHLLVMMLISTNQVMITKVGHGKTVMTMSCQLLSLVLTTKLINTKLEMITMHRLINHLLGTKLDSVRLETGMMLSGYSMLLQVLV